MDQMSVLHAFKVHIKVRKELLPVISAQIRPSPERMDPQASVTALSVCVCVCSLNSNQ